MEDMPMTDRPRALTRVFGSVALLAALAGAVPWALVRVAAARFGGPAPWTGVDPPTTWDAETVRGALTTRLTEALIADLLIRTALVVAWVAVAVVLVTVVVEVLHQVRHDGIPLPSVRGLGWGQPLARYVATGLIMVTASFGSARVAAVPVPVPERVAIEVSGGTIGAGPTGEGRSGVVARGDATSDVTVPETRADRWAQQAGGATAIGEYVVEPGDSVYAIAERLAGPDPAAVVGMAERILDLNLGKQMTGGQRFVNAAYIEPGWVLQLPDRPRPQGTVAPERTDPSRHVVVRGDTLSGIAAARLDDATRWPEIFELNAGRTMSDGRRLDDPHLILPGWELHLPTATAPIEPEVSEVPEVPELPELPERGQSEPELPEPELAEPELPEPELSDPAPSEPEPVGSEPDMFEPTPVDDAGEAATSGPVGLGRAAMLSVGVLALLAALRARRLRSSGPHARVPEPRPAAIATERRLRAVDADERLVRLDLALRAVAGTIADRDRQVRAALVAGDGAVEVVLTGPCHLPSPWTGTACRWTLPSEVTLEELAGTARTIGAPCVALVQLGIAEDGRDLYVDLEALGALGIEAEPSAASAVTSGIAATLGSSPFAEVARLVGVGVDEGRFLGHPHVETATTLDAAITLAGELVGTTAAAGESTFALRARGLGGETWEPAIVVADPAGTDGIDGTVEPADATSLAIEPSRGIAVVTTSCARRCPARLTGGTSGWHLTLGAPDDPDTVSFVLEPVALPPDDAADVDDLLDAERPDAQRTVAAPVDDGWTEGPAWPDDEPDESVVDPGVPAPPPSADADPEPDWSVMVRLLGPVDVVARDGPVAEFEKSKTRELLAWLATHRERPTRTGARTALWDLDVRDATFANVVSAARRTLARLVPPPVGEEWVGRTQTERLPLHPEVVTDADLVEARLAAARGRPPIEAVDVLRPAVELIRGMPFEGTSYLWPDAEGLTSRLVLLATSATTELAEHLLALGDVAGVFHATGRGLRVLPGHEELIALRMRAHASTGDHAGVRHEWEAYERVITGDPWSDGEPAPKLVGLRDELLRAA